MSERTLEQALARAEKIREQMKADPIPHGWALEVLEDFVLLADEVKRLQDLYDSTPWQE